ncbi:MAG: zinc dependent phospholipase C family protein [Christensenellaceae bacterium]
MRKAAHWIITNYMLEGKADGWKRFLTCIGSVLPDVFLHTYRKGHKYATRQKEVLSSLDRLSRKKHFSPLTCLRLGMQLHYLEDFFTYPHNDVFTGSLSSHIAYEGEQLKRLKQLLPKAIFLRPLAPDDLNGWICDCHAKYLASEHNPETDLTYIVSVAGKVIDHVCCRTGTYFPVASVEDLLSHPDVYLAEWFEDLASGLTEVFALPEELLNLPKKLSLLGPALKADADLPVTTP